MSQNRIAAVVKQLESRERHEGLVVIPLDDGSQITLSLTDAGPVGLAFDELVYQSARLDDRAPDVLRAWADRLVARLTYLMEPLVVVEHDREANAVAVRSNPPALRGDRRTYYEIVLRGNGSLKLTRVAYDETTRARQTVPCQMTVEALDRLADDLAACSK